MNHESYEINPGKWQDNNGRAYGIVQWDPASKYLNWASKNDYAADSLPGQLAFLVYSMQPGAGEWLYNKNYPDYYMSYSDFIVSTESVDYLTKVFLHSYERAGWSATDKRIGYADYWFGYFGT